MSEVDLPSVDRARELHLGALRSARDHGFDLKLGPGETLEYAHEVIAMDIPSAEIQALDLAYFGLERRMQNPLGIEKLDDVLRQDHLIWAVRKGRINIQRPPENMGGIAWQIAVRISELPIEMREFEQIQIEHDEFVRRIVDDEPALP